MTRDVDQSGQLDPLAEVRRRIQQLEAAIVAQNEVIATLELRGRDARKARAVRAGLWISQETDLAEMARLLHQKRKPRRSKRIARAIPERGSPAQEG
jgi:hypothetical protein